MRLFFFGRPRPPLQAIEPLSVSFSSPPTRSKPAESVIVDDLGVPGRDDHQNDVPGFWSEGRR